MASSAVPLARSAPARRARVERVLEPGRAYCLTGQGMQGGTVEHAIVLVSVRDLTKGWSYTALSRSAASRANCATLTF